MNNLVPRFLKSICMEMSNYIKSYATSRRVLELKCQPLPRTIANLTTCNKILNQINLRSSSHRTFKFH